MNMLVPKIACRTNYAQELLASTEHGQTSVYWTTGKYVVMRIVERLYRSYMFMHARKVVTKYARTYAQSKYT